MAQQLKVITQKKKSSSKKYQLKQKTPAESNTEKEEHGIATEEKSEIVIPQPALAHTDTDEAKNSSSRSNPSKIEPPKHSEEWRKGTPLITGDSMIAGFRESKLSSNKEDKGAIFSWRKNRRSNVSLNPKTKKKPDNIIIHSRMNDAPYKNENVLYEELTQIKDLIMAHHLDCNNICISCPIVRTDNKKAKNVLKKYIDISKRDEKNVIFHNTLESHLYRDGLHLNSNGTT